MPKILVVDDEPDMVTILKRVLEINGYEVITAKSGKEGLNRVHEEAPNLIILDVMLPDMTGYEVCKRLKQDRKKKEIPVLLLTARSQEKDFLEGIDAKANGYITKPFDPFRLVERIKRTLEG